MTCGIGSVYRRREGREISYEGVTVGRREGGREMSIVRESNMGVREEER